MKAFRVLCILIIATMILGACQTTPQVVEREVVVTTEVEREVIITTEVETEIVVTVTPQPIEREPVILRQGATAAPGVLNPMFGDSVSEEIIWNLVYDRLFEINWEKEFIPILAKEWEMSEDGMTWTIDIHSGVQFHDGQPLTAEDVAFTINLNKTRLDSRHAAEVKFVESAEATSETTIVIQMESAIPNMIDNLATIWILPKHIYEPLGLEE